MGDLTIPQNTKELGIAIKKLAEARRHVALQAAETESAIAFLKEKLSKVTKQRREKILVLESAIEVYCDAHRAELTSGGLHKSVDFAHGSVCWRTKPASVSFLQTDEVIVAELIEAGLEELIRIKKEPDKKKILAAAEEVEDFPDIVILKDEESFTIKTNENALPSAA